MTARLATLLLIALVPLSAAAQEPPPPPPPAQPSPPAHWGTNPTARRHFGLFIRPELGLAYTSSKGSQAGVDLSVMGSGGAFALAVGGSVSEDFIVAAQVWDFVATSPTVKISGGGISASSSTSSGTSSGLVGYGVLLNWYFQPSNLYLAVTPSLTRLVFSDPSASATSEWGFGVRATFGKEWWVSDRWGLGLAASVGLSSNKDKGTNPPTITSTGASLTFSATYN
jgi:hypothetical protein